MWLCTIHGFFSIVRAHGDEGKPHDTLYMIRARDEWHLQSLLTSTLDCKKYKLPILRSAGTDYPVRVIVNKDIMLQIVNAAAGAIDYCNFKGAVHDLPASSITADYLGFLHQVWQIGRDYLQAP